MFGVGIVLALRLPAKVDSTEGETPTTLSLDDTGPIPRRTSVGSAVVIALRANGALRAFSGFLHACSSRSCCGRTRSAGSTTPSRSAWSPARPPIGQRDRYDDRLAAAHPRPADGDRRRARHRHRRRARRRAGLRRRHRAGRRRSPRASRSRSASCRWTPSCSATCRRRSARRRSRGPRRCCSCPGWSAARSASRCRSTGRSDWGLRPPGSRACWSVTARSIALRRRREGGLMERRRLGRTGHESSVLIYGAAALGRGDPGGRRRLGAGGAGRRHQPPRRRGELRRRRAAPRSLDAADQGAGVPRHQDRRPRRRGRLGGRSTRRWSGCRPTTSTCCSCTRSATSTSSTWSPARAARWRPRCGRQDEGLVGAVGITGHGDGAPTTHLEALRRHPFATVLTPMNVVLHRDAAFRAAYEELADEVARQDAGADAHQDRRPAELGARPRSAATPPGTSRSTTRRSITAAVSWALSLPGVTGLATPGDVRLLGMVVEAERSRIEPDEAARARSAPSRRTARRSSTCRSEPARPRVIRLGLHHGGPASVSWPRSAAAVLLRRADGLGALRRRRLPRPATVPHRATALHRQRVPSTRRSTAARSPAPARLGGRGDRDRRPVRSRSTRWPSSGTAATPCSPTTTPIPAPARIG